MEIEVTRQVDAPAEAVWDVLTDIPAAAQTLSDVIAVETLTPGPYAPGYRWRETRKMMGTKATAEMMVTAAEPPLRTEVVCEDAGTEYLTVFTVEPADAGGCRLTVRFRSETTHAPMAARVSAMLMAPLMRGAARKGFEKDLADIETEARRRSA